MELRGVTVRWFILCWTLLFCVGVQGYFVSDKDHSELDFKDAGIFKSDKDIYSQYANPELGKSEDEDDKDGNKEDNIKEDDCDCGEHQVNCTRKTGGKVECVCKPLYAQKEEKCEDCDCGTNANGCEFVAGLKVCNCTDHYKENDGFCQLCYCGEHAKDCKYENGKKVCECKENYNDSMGTCKECDCGTNSNACHFQQEQKVCECKDLHKENDGFCELCECGEFGECRFIDGKKNCTCVTNFGDKDGQCIDCKCGMESTGCFFQFGVKTCYCNAGYLQNNELCEECDCGSHGSCSIHSITDERICVCDEKYAEKSKKCVECDCGEQSTDCTFKGDAKTCTCNKGHVQDKEKCAACDCGDSGTCSLVNGEKQCACEPGFGEKKGTCVDCECGKETTSCSFEGEAKTCICNNGHKENNSKCEECDCGNFGSCDFIAGVRTCDCREYFLVKDGKCVECYCGEGSISCDFEGDEKICKCQVGHKINNSICEACDCGEFGKCDFVEGQKNCTCNEGFGEKNGTCVACECGKESTGCTFEEDVKTCICKDGHKESKGKCEECDCGTYGSCDFITGVRTCDCKKNYAEKDKKCVACDCGKKSTGCTFDKDGKTCLCKDGHKEDNGECKECDCGPSTHGSCDFKDGVKTCNCSAGYGENDNKCVDCDCGEQSSGCTFDKGKKTCICKPGHKEYNGKCKECDCGPSTHGSCDFKDGLKSCNCNPGYKEKNKKCVETCSDDDECENGGKCTDEFCVCGNGLEGDLCEIIKECSLSLKNCTGNNGKCIYKDGKAYCQCGDGKHFDESTQFCREKCKKAEDCKNGAICEKEFCVCKKGTSGDDCSAVDGCTDKLKKTCTDAQAECIFDETNEVKATCRCKDKNFVFDGKGCFAEWCRKDTCQDGAVCFFEPKTETGYCSCETPTKYYDYKRKKCLDVDPCEVLKTPCKQNEVCKEGNCICAPGYTNTTEGGKCTPNACTNKPCFGEAECTETDIPGAVKCSCKQGFYYDGSKCADGRCFLEGHRKQCKENCPGGMKREDDGECKPTEKEQRCGKKCGFGWCIKVNDKEVCRCMKVGQNIEGVCVLKPEVCASKELTKDKMKCSCTGHFRYAKDKLTCERLACADEDAQKLCRASGAVRCQDRWKITEFKRPGYTCLCGDGYKMDNNSCTDACSTQQAKQLCSKDDKMCYNEPTTPGGQPTGTCRCPPPLSWDSDSKKCSSISGNSYMLHNVPVLKKKYARSHGIDQVLLNTDIIAAMKQMYGNLQVANLYSYKATDEVLKCSIWLEFKTDSKFDLKRFQFQKQTSINCTDCDEKLLLLPPSLLLSPKNIEDVSDEKLKFCSTSVKDALCGRDAFCTNGQCACLKGFKIIDYSIKKSEDFTILRCEDIDECTLGIHSCSANTTCVNTNGDYYCKCKDGYKKSQEKMPYKNDENKDSCVDLCTPNPCDKGKCVVLKNNMFDCNCEAGFGGSLCARTDSNFAKAKHNTVVVGAVLGTLLGITLILVFIYIRRMRKNSYSEDFTPAPRQADNAEMMERRPMRGATNRGYQ